jgi:hypothetical protein
MKIESVIERLEGWVKGQKIILNVAKGNWKTFYCA